MLKRIPLCWKRTQFCSSSVRRPPPAWRRQSSPQQPLAARPLPAWQLHDILLPIRLGSCKTYYYPYGVHLIAVSCSRQSLVTALSRCWQSHGKTPPKPCARTLPLLAEPEQNDSHCVSPALLFLDSSHHSARRRATAGILRLSHMGCVAVACNSTVIVPRHSRTHKASTLLLFLAQGKALCPRFAGVPGCWQSHSNTPLLAWLLHCCFLLKA